MAVLRHSIAALLALASFAAVAAWCIGRLLTDRYGLTQYIFWLPGVLLVPPAVFLACSAAVVERVGRGRHRLGRKGARVWRRLLRANAALSVVVLAVMSVTAWRVQHLVFPPARAAPGRAVTVLHWNMMGQAPYVWSKELSALPDHPFPDLILLTNVHQGRRFSFLSERLGEEYHVVHSAYLAIASRFDIVRWGGTSLDLPAPAAFGSALPTELEDAEGLNPKTRPGRADPGHVAWAELDTTAVLGRTIVVWIIDLPSDIRIPRVELARRVAARLRDMRAGVGGEAFPQPDLLAGDFNIPRGSYSLSLLTPGMHDAFGEAGLGFAASYPAHRPLWHIDHIFLRPPLRATSYRLDDLGGSTHLAQRATVTIDR